MAPITINSQREEAIDFTTQFYAEVVGVGLKINDNDWFYLFRPLQVLNTTNHFVLFFCGDNVNIFVEPLILSV